MPVAFGLVYLPILGLLLSPGISLLCFPMIAFSAPILPIRWFFSSPVRSVSIVSAPLIVGTEFIIVWLIWIVRISSWRTGCYLERWSWIA